MAKASICMDLYMYVCIYIYVDMYRCVYIHMISNERLHIKIHDIYIYILYIYLFIYRCIQDDLGPAFLQPQKRNQLIDYLPRRPKSCSAQGGFGECFIGALFKHVQTTHI